MNKLVYSYNEKLLSNKKEWATDTYNNMDDYKNQYKWENPVQKCTISLIYNSRTSKTNPWWEKVSIVFEFEGMGMDIDWKGTWGKFLKVIALFYILSQQFTLVTCTFHCI